MSYILLITGWIIYFALHSILAADAIKKHFPWRLYRILYVLISIVGLLAMLFFNDSIHSVNFLVSEGPVRYISLLLTTFGVMIIQSSFRQYSFKGFIGAGEEIKTLRTEGVLQYVRHPILAGVILVVVGFFFFIPNVPTLISCICVLVYVPIGMYLEEKRLVAIYGDEYREYRKRVPAIVPFLHGRT
jgi:protein-S-isoprenylcysteine O-methyltransferase Ste14